LGQVIGLCEANVPCPKCGGRKQHKEQSPTAVFWNPRAQTAPAAVTVC